MTRLFYTLFAIILINFQSFSQTVEPSSAIDKSILQIELESLYTIQKEDSKKMKSWSIPSALFRYGFLEGYELQLNTPIIKEKLWENDHLIHSLNKFDDIQVGFSVNLWKQQKFIPEASLMVRAILPTDSKFELNKIGKICSLNLSNSISQKFSFNYNIGYVLETDDSKSGFYIANIGFEANSKLHFFIENFGDFTNKKLMSHNINTGVGYNFNEKLILDVSVANGLNHNMFYVGGILTYVLNTKKINI